MGNSANVSIFDQISQLFADKSPSDLKHILVIDAMNMFMRSFNMVNHIDADGDPVGGLSGFLRSVGASIKLHTPSEVYIIFDGEGSSSTKRNLYSAYKGNRKIGKVSNPLLYSTKEDERTAIYSQARRCVGYCKLLPVKVICVDTMEADDVIGAMSKQFEKDDNVTQVTIVTEDRDYMQLISNKISVYLPIQKMFATTDFVLTKYMSHPNNFALYKSLKGDVADNVPGVDRLGDKTIEKLLPFLRDVTKYDLKYLYNYCLERIESDKMYSKILAFKDQIDINYKLVNLHGIEFLDNDQKDIDALIQSKDVTYDPEMFLRLYNEDGLANTIPNVRAWLREVYQPLFNKQK